MTEILEWKCPRCSKTYDGTVDECSCGYVLGGVKPKIKQESGTDSRFKNRKEYEAWKAQKIKENGEKRQQSLGVEESDINHYYEILGLKPNATKEEIKQAYKDLLTVWNPDKFSNEPNLQQKAREKVKEIDEAFEKLILYFLKSSEQPSRISQSPRNTTIVSPASGADKNKFSFFSVQPNSLKSGGYILIVLGVINIIIGILGIIGAANVQFIAGLILLGLGFGVLKQYPFCVYIGTVIWGLGFIAFCIGYFTDIQTSFLPPKKFPVALLIQFWFLWELLKSTPAYANFFNKKSVSRGKIEIASCYKCGLSLDKNAAVCPHCKALLRVGILKFLIGIFVLLIIAILYAVTQ